MVEKKLKKTTKKTAVKKVKTGLSMPVYSIDGKELKTTELSKEIFAVKENPQLLAQYVRVYLANQRQGTASSKTRGQVTGSTRKIYRQKGTGRARHGDIKAPIFVGGGIVGGPQPRDYSLKINKKQKRKAFLSALTLKYKEGSFCGLTDKALTIEPKTKTIVKLIKNIQMENKRILFVLPKLQKSNLILAARNIPKTNFFDAVSLNAYELLRAQKIIFVGNALTVLEKHLLNEN